MEDGEALVLAPGRLFWVLVGLHLAGGFVAWQVLVAPEVYSSDMNLWVMLLGGAAAVTLLIGVRLLASQRTRRQGVAVAAAAFTSALGNATGFLIGWASGVT